MSDNNAGGAGATVQLTHGGAQSAATRRCCRGQLIWPGGPRTPQLSPEQQRCRPRREAPWPSAPHHHLIRCRKAKYDRHLENLKDYCWVAEDIQHH